MIIKQINNIKPPLRNITNLNYNGTILNTPNDIAEAFNKYFTDVAPSLDNELPDTPNNPLTYSQGDLPDSMVIPVTSIDDVVSAIKLIKNKKVHINEMLVSILKENAALFAYPLMMLFS